MVHPDSNGAPALSAGRLYAGGLACELEAVTPLSAVARRALRPASGRTDLVFLDAWEHVVTAVDDPDLIDWAIDFVEDVGRC
jgi:hypothetical protein